MLQLVCVGDGDGGVGGGGEPALTRVHDLMWSDSQLVPALPGVGECGMCSDWGVCVCVCDRTRPALP